MKKTILITGATGAVGKATAMELAKNNCKIILLGRNQKKLSAVKDEITKNVANADIEIEIADLNEPKSIKSAADNIRKKYSTLNVLINVAGIYKPTRQENSSGLESMFATNHLGPFVLTNELLDVLKANTPSRVVTVSAPSTTKLNFEDLQSKQKFSSFTAFGASKMMNLMFAYALTRRLEGKGVTSNVLHPGLVKSDLTNDMPAMIKFMIRLMSGKPDKAARMLCRLALDKEFENTNGKFFKAGGKEIKSNAYSYDKELQEKLWTISEELATKS